MVNWVKFDGGFGKGAYSFEKELISNNFYSECSSKAPVK